MGQTDGNGRFSNTAKDGSWMFMDVFMFKPGFQRIRYQRILNQTYITDKYKIYQDYVGKHPAWEDELRSMGYRLDTTSTTNNYFKKFELGAEYQNITAAAWNPEGERQYWVSKRGIPDGSDLSSLGIYTCYSRVLGKTDPDAEFVGYKGPDYDEDSPWNLEKSIDAYNVICDEKWDSVTPDFASTSSNRYAAESSGVVPKANYDALKSLLPDDYAIPVQSGSTKRAMRRIERLNYYNYVAPFIRASKEWK